MGLQYTYELSPPEEISNFLQDNQGADGLDMKNNQSAFYNYAISQVSQNGISETLRLFNDSIFYDACKNGNFDKVKSLLAGGEVDPSAYDNRAIVAAATYGHSKIVKLLLADKRVDPSVRDNCSIRQASAFGHWETVELLLADERVDPSADNNYAILYASAYGSLKVVQLLLADKRVDPATDDNDAIRLAAENGHWKIVELLLADRRVYSLKLEGLTIKAQKFIVAYLFQRYRYLPLPEASQDLIEVITGIVVSA